MELVATAVFESGSEGKTIVSFDGLPPGASANAECRIGAVVQGGTPRIAKDPDFLGVPDGSHETCCDEYLALGGASGRQPIMSASNLEEGRRLECDRRSFYGSPRGVMPLAFDRAPILPGTP